MNHKDMNKINQHVFNIKILNRISSFSHRSISDCGPFGYFQFPRSITFITGVKLTQNRHHFTLIWSPGVSPHSKWSFGMKLFSCVYITLLALSICTSFTFCVVCFNIQGCIQEVSKNNSLCTTGRNWSKTVLPLQRCQCVKVILKRCWFSCVII